MPPRTPDDDFDINLTDLDLDGGLSGDESTISATEEEAKNIQEAFEGELVFNGINEEGQYGLEPMTSEELSAKIQGESYCKNDRERARIQQELSDAQPALLGLTQSQFNLLTKNLSDERKALIVGLDKNKGQAELLVNLIKKPWGFDMIMAAEPFLFSTMPQAEFEALLKIQEKFYKDEIANLKPKLFAGLDETQHLMIDAMLEELWAFFYEEKRQKMLDDKTKKPFPVPADVDPTDLRQAGWGIVFPASMENTQKDTIKQALAELIEWRKQQIGDRVGTHFKVYENEQGYLFGESKDDFLQRHRVGSGIAYPEEMPFYILLIGSPEEIPFEFQYQLDVMRAVGRLDFGDDYAAYRQYAHNVVLAESGSVKLDRRAAFFAVQNDKDKATTLSARHLIAPLTNSKELFPAQEDEEEPGKKDEKATVLPKWQFDLCGGGKATKDALEEILSGNNAPALLFTASHGMEFKMDDAEKQMKGQGALLCQDWPGSGAVKPEYYFAAEDVPSDANLLGMIAILFACYGAGTPREDQFEAKVASQPKQIAARSFIGALPKQLLRQGALAVMGHVERAWGYSFVSPGGFLENKHFVEALKHLFRGEPIGWATDDTFNARYADRSSALSVDLQNPSRIDPRKLSQTWIASNDSRGYVVIGDPAVRLPLAAPGEKPKKRPALESVVAPSLVTTSTATSSASAGAEKISADVDKSFGLLGIGKKEDKEDGGEKAEGGPLQALQNIASDLAKKIGAAIEELTSLEVNTYTSSNLEGVVYDAGEKRFKGQLKMRARTYISFDGDMEICLPVRDDGSVDRELWQIHSEMVKQAQVNRTEFLKTVADLAARLVGK